MMHFLIETYNPKKLKSMFGDGGIEDVWSKNHRIRYYNLPGTEKLNEHIADMDRQTKRINLSNDHLYFYRRKIVKLVQALP